MFHTKSNRLDKLLLMVLIIGFISVVSIEKLNKPIPLNSVEAIKEVKEIFNGVEITFNEIVDGYEINDNNKIITAWKTRINNFNTNFGEKSIKVDFNENETKQIGYYEIENDGKIIIIYGKPLMGGSNILPRLAMSYYSTLAIILSIISLILAIVFKNAKYVKKLFVLSFAFGIAYLFSSLVIMGWAHSTYFMIRDLSYVIISTLILFAGFYILLSKHNIIQ
ncbi:MAG: hypothetical protein GX769_03430 [Erysipelothrix sp.]|nr:hypothetical protein [Erysipelothrix sp.]